MKNKGQFMIISAVIASLITITMSTTISDIQNQRYQDDDLPEKVSLIKGEIQELKSPSSPGGTSITSKEKRNFRKLLGYLDDYQTSANFNSAQDCISVTLQSTEKRVEIPCTD